MRKSLVTALAVAAISSGCLTEIFVDTTLTTREFLCAVLAPNGVERVVVDVRVESGIGFSPIAVTSKMVEQLTQIAGRAPDSIEVQIQEPNSSPKVWDDLAWEEELSRYDTRDGGNSIRFTVYWLKQMPGDATGVLVRSGLVALDAGGLADKVQATGKPFQDVALATLLHHTGHALGAVNQGIPMQANHEGVPGHDHNETSVMHSSLDDPFDPTWPAGASYDSYDHEMRRDWAAVANELVCP